ncbi:hypothetical protein PBY51_003554 [Eleginops maclovinus]|uniref:Uncharacterized protein n=1 Tax=Eleginops maclovinus TaxID=56733 RepID=A0AAN7Y096_ELEMC|nr:hypothetical protein PBY51_003554 [Eleginops maclovinus]
MSEMEHKYYEDQKTERRMFCSKGVDPVWYHSMMRTKRLRERSEEYQRKRDQQFSYQTLDHITDILIETGEISSCSSDEEKEGTPPNQLRQSLRLTHSFKRRVKRVRCEQNPKEGKNSSQMLLN